jgi:UDP-hydrolysing UDP-N-acetyl-D-glucosamine 2-epimerase
LRTVGVVTVGRSDYGVYVPILRRIQADPELQLQLIVGGMHLSPEFGTTVNAIESDGFEVSQRVEFLLSSDTPEGIAKSMGLGITGFAQAYSAKKPDVLLVLGDRFEMHAAALAALPFKIPIAHVHGGEITEGAIDDALRHSITKLSHLHFVSTEEYQRRVLQLGEEAWRVEVTGAPGLDNLHSITLLSQEELGAQFGLRLDNPTLLVTYHPVTLEYEQTDEQVQELLAALGKSGHPMIFTIPNADTSGRSINAALRQYVESHDSAQIVDNLGTQGYFSLMACAAAMVGNSSSGIAEAPSFGLPVVNIGNRQQGRLRTRNIIDVGYSQEEILSGIQKAISPEFRVTYPANDTTYGDGRAAERIVARLKSAELNQRLIAKKFIDYPIKQQGELNDSKPPKETMASSSNRP